MPRPTPFDLVFRPICRRTSSPESGPALDQAGHDPRDRDRFLMLREVVTLLRELRPEEGLGEGIDQLAALVHHAYLFWDAGAADGRRLRREQLTALLAAPAAPSRQPSPRRPTTPRCREHRIWAEVIPGQPPEPLDGCFVHSSPDRGDAQGARRLRHPSRAGRLQRGGSSRAAGLWRWPAQTARAAVRAHAPGGEAAGLFSITGEEELLDLGWRITAGSWELGAKSQRLRARSGRAPSSQLLAPSSYGKRKGLHGQEGGGAGAGADRRLSRAQERKPLSHPGVSDRGACPGELPGRSAAVAGRRHPRRGQGRRPGHAPDRDRAGRHRPGQHAGRAAASRSPRAWSRCWRSRAWVLPRSARSTRCSASTRYPSWRPPLTMAAWPSCHALGPEPRRTSSRPSRSFARPPHSDSTIMRRRKRKGSGQRSSDCPASPAR